MLNPLTVILSGAKDSGYSGNFEKNLVPPCEIKIKRTRCSFAA